MTDLEKMLIEVLEIYAEKANWSETARQDVLTGEVRADGWEESVEAELVMHDAVVWEYDGGAGYALAQAASMAVFGVASKRGLSGLAWGGWLLLTCRLTLTRFLARLATGTRCKSMRLSIKIF